MPGPWYRRMRRGLRQRRRPGLFGPVQGRHDDRLQGCVRRRRGGWLRRRLLLRGGADGQVRQVLFGAVVRPSEDRPVQHHRGRRHRTARAGARR